MIRAVPAAVQCKRLLCASVFFVRFAFVERLHGAADVGLDPGLDARLDRLVAHEIHVGKARRPAGEHLQNRQRAAAANVLRAQAVLRREHVIEQPALQRQVAPKPAQKRHGTVAMAVDEARDEQFVLKIPPRIVPRVRRRGFG